MKPWLPPRRVGVTRDDIDGMEEGLLGLLRNMTSRQRTKPRVKDNAKNNVLKFWGSYL